MKTIFTLIFILSFLSLICQTPQKNYGGDTNGLKFSKAFFLGFKASESRKHIAVNDTFSVPKDKVWCITSAKEFMVKGEGDIFENDILLRINGFIIDYYKSQFVGPLWLPEGKYNIQLLSKDGGNNIDFQAYISGIEYAIDK